MQTLFKHFYLSGALTPSATAVRLYILEGIVGLIINNFKWLRQGAPSREDWDICRAHVLILLNSSLVLGKWLQPAVKALFYSTEENCLFQKQNDCWLRYHVLGRARRGYFSLIGYGARNSP